MRTKREIQIRNNLAHPTPTLPKNTMPRTGTEILDALVLIADHAHKDFTPDLLTKPWKQEGFSPVKEHLYNIINILGFFIPPYNNPHQPFAAFDATLKTKKKEDINSRLAGMHIVNQKKLDAILPAEELYVQQVLVWYSLNQSKKLYSGKNLPAWFEELGCPKQLIPRMVQAYIHYQEFNGKSDEDVVKQEILAALMPHKQNPEGTSIEGILVGPSDIFSYQGRYFVLQRESEFREGGRAKVLETNDAGWICLLLGIVIKTAKCEPLAYALLKAPEQQPRLLEEGSAPAHLLL